MKAIFIISGEKKTGKTCLLQQLVSVLIDTGYSLKGFYAEYEKTTDSYSIKNIQTQDKVLLMSRTCPPENKPNHFQINKSGIQTGTRWLELDECDDTSILILDEIGYYELNGMIWNELFLKVIESPNPLILTTKTKLLPEIIKKWNFLPSAVFYPPEFKNIEKAAKQIIYTLKLYEKDSF